MALCEGRTQVRSYILALVPVIILAAGCVSTRAIYLNPTGPTYPKVAPDEVRIFTTEAELDSLVYVRIAIIEATGSGEYTSQTDMLTAMRKKAADLGANGVLLPQINEPGAGAKVAGAIFGTRTQRKGNAVAVRILGTKPAH
jgi:hypothetical protein